MSGRGLGHTGGTLDKLESIPGFNIYVSEEDFIKQVNDIGLAIIGQSATLVPADKKIYALRDVTGTVSCIPLIASSIMSKKLASGADTILLDVKYGNAIGNSLEVIEAIETLKGKGPQDLEELCLKAGSTMLVQAKLYQDESLAYKALQEVISDGKALEKLKEMVQRQGGDVSYIENPELFEKPSVIMKITSKKTGYVQSLEAKNLGIVSMKLGGGRMTKDEDVDHAVGLVLNKKIGDHVEIGETLLTVYARNELSQELLNEIYQSYTIVDEFVEKPILIEEIMK